MSFLKVIIPPLVAFLVFAAIIRYNPLGNNLEGISDIGNGMASGLIDYYKIFAPFQFMIAVLTQYLIIMPLWDKILLNHRSAFGIFVGIILVCLVIATGISYVIWDKATGTQHWISITLFMTGVQLLYWSVNFLTLAVLNWKTLQGSGKLKGKN